MAAREGHVAVLRWALEQRCTPSRMCSKNAAEGGHLEALWCALSYGSGWEPTSAQWWASLPPDITRTTGLSGMAGIWG
eukprot:scaffold233403_cov33-Tisochrysis_lutea.AAC.2